MTEKRYQVFISSTFVDLVAERQAVLKAILEIGHMPAGMELFPANDESAWDLIKTVINESDYYVLIIGGRYGSEHDSGIGYTEMEYDYAVEQKKSVVALIHEKPESIPRAKTEVSELQWKKLEAFRAKVQKKHTVVGWSDANGLKAALIVSLTAQIRKKPAIGWIRADTVTPGTRAEDVLILKDRISELEQLLAKASVEPLAGSEDLAQGEELLEIVGSVRTAKYEYPEVLAEVSWDTLFSSIGPVLLNEAMEQDLRAKITSACKREIRAELVHYRVEEDKSAVISVYVSSEIIDTIIIQFRALGLIAESKKKRSLTDVRKYWALTPYGDLKIVQLRALRSGEQAKQEPDTDIDENDVY